MEQKVAKFQTGDIVNFNASGGTFVGEIIEGERFKYDSWVIRVIGDNFIVGSHHFYKYHPHGYEREEYCEIIKDIEATETTCGSFEARMKIASIPEKKIKFSLLQKDNIILLKDELTDGERFKIMLRGLWKNLVVQKVKFVDLKAQKMSCVTKYTLDEKGNQQDKFSVDSSSLSADKEEAVYEINYSHYFGFTMNNVHFARENYNSFDWTISETGYFGTIGNFLGGYCPPLKGQYICGIIEENQKGKFFKKWFTCSQQFFEFWSFIMSEKKEALNSQYIANLRKLTDTSHYHTDNYSNVPLNALERKKKLDFISHSFQHEDFRSPMPYRTLLNFIIKNEYNKHYSSLFYNIAGFYKR